MNTLANTDTQEEDSYTSKLRCCLKRLDTRYYKINNSQKQLKMKTVKAYQCDFCSYYRKNTTRVKAHEEICHYNPSTKSCGACKHLSKWTCSRGIAFPERKNRLPLLKTGCPEFEVKGDVSEDFVETDDLTEMQDRKTADDLGIDSPVDFDYPTEEDDVNEIIKYFT